MGEMMPDRQVQKGGETQLQAARDIVIGLRYEEAKEIIETRATLLRHELTVHAESLVQERLTTFEEKLLSSLSASGVLDAFANPDFQFNILEGQRSAARSGRAEDIDLLIDLLEQRASTPESPRLKVATRRALDVVGQLSQSSLAGLSALWYGISLRPSSLLLEDNLAAMANHFRPLVDALPKRQEWLFDLDLLGCLQVGIGGFSNLKTFVQLLGENSIPGFTCLGMDDEIASRHREALGRVHATLPGLLVSHPLDPSRYCLLGPEERQIRTTAVEMATTLQISESTIIAVLEDVIQDNNYDSRLGNWETLLREKVREFPILAQVDDWWAGQKLPGLQVTSVGIAVAYANLRRLLPGQLPSRIDSLLNET